MGCRYRREKRRSKKLIRGNSAEFNYAHYCLHKLKILPSVFANMDINEKIFIMASIDLKVEAEKKEEKKAKSGRRR